MKTMLPVEQGKENSRLQEILNSMDQELYALVVGQETNRPLQEAFAAKRVLHNEMGGKMLERSSWSQLWQQTLEQPSHEQKRSAYIHIPFCQKKCLYCGFFQNACQEELETAYIDRLVAELKMNAQSPYMTVPINAVFIGGGTPSALSPKNTERLLKAIHEFLPLANDYELTLEGRVHDVVPEKMDVWFKNGVNRVSLGVQSFNTKVRQAVGRIDKQEVIFERLEQLKNYNQASIIIDLIYGLPYQTEKIWLEDIAALKYAAIDGWDLYQLNVYENSALKQEIDAGRLPPAATTEEQSEMFSTAHQILSGWPVKQISVCHWAKNPRERNMYNVMAQQGHTMLPYGAGAGGKVGSYSLMQERDINRYNQRLDKAEKPIMMMMALGESTEIYDEVKNQMKLGYLDITELAEKFDRRLHELEILTNLWAEKGLVNKRGKLVYLAVAGQFWYVNLTQSVIECIHALLHGGWSWRVQKVAAQG